MADGRVTVFEDAASEWRWQVRGGNGEITATSEGYTSPSDAERGFEDHCRIITALIGSKPERVSS